MPRPLAAQAAFIALAILAACGSGRERLVMEAPACTTDVRESVLPDEMVQDLGTLAVGTMATFVVPAGTASFFIFSQEADNSAAAVASCGLAGRQPNAVVPTNLRAPDDTLYYDDFVEWPSTTIGPLTYPDVSAMLAYDIGFQAVSGALPVPNTSAAVDTLSGGVPPGTWKFILNDWAYTCPFDLAGGGGNSSGRYRVHVVTRPAFDPSAAATLDVEVYLATDETSVLATKALAQVHPRVARWKQSLAHYLENAGIVLGAVTFNDLAPSVRDVYAPNGEVSLGDGGPCSSVNQLFTHAIRPSRAVHLFLADQLVAPNVEPGISIVGLDGSIPGPSGFPGTIYGGAIVGLDDFAEGTDAACSGDPNLTSCGTDRLAYVTAHEIGHWLGLYHTTEQDGWLFDPVADTDRCACSSCAPIAQRSACSDAVGFGGTTIVTNGSCTAGGNCGGGRNLMFWLLDPGFSTGELSPHQGRIVRLNPAVQ